MGWGGVTAGQNFLEPEVTALYLFSAFELKNLLLGPIETLGSLWCSIQHDERSRTRSTLGLAWEGEGQRTFTFFAAKVVASVRKLKEDRRVFWANWLRFGLPGALAGALAVFLTVFSVRVEHKIETKPVIVTQTEPSDLELIADLDSALSSEESSVWLDSSSH